MKQKGTGGETQVLISWGRHREQSRANETDAGQLWTGKHAQGHD